MSLFVIIRLCGLLVRLSTNFMTFLLFIVMITVLLSSTVASCRMQRYTLLGYCGFVVVLWDFLFPPMLCRSTVTLKNLQSYLNLGIICYLRYSASLELNFMPQLCMFVCVCAWKKRHKYEKVWPLYTVLMFMLAQLCWRKPYHSHNVHSQTEK